MLDSEIFSRKNGLSDVSKGPEVIGVACAALICPWITVCLRIYVRIGIQKVFGKDDYLAVTSLLVLSILCAILIRVSLHFGLGSHLSQLSRPSLVELSRTTFICEILYILTTTLTKLSIGFYFLRLTRKRYQRLILYAIIVIAVTYSTAFLVFTILQCKPIDFVWRQHEFHRIRGKCQKIIISKVFTYIHAGMSIVIDCLYGILPILFLWKLEIELKKKLSVMFILSLSFFGSIATIVRLVYIFSLKDITDYTWEGVGLIKWSIIEPAIALTAAAIMTLRPLSQKLCTSRRHPHSLIAYKSQDSSRNSVMSYSSEFEGMLGLTFSPGVRTWVHAGSSTDGFSLRRNPSWFKVKKGLGRSRTSLYTPLWSQSRRGCKKTKGMIKNFSSWYRHKNGADSRNVNLSLENLENGNQSMGDPNNGIMRTVVVTRRVGGEEIEDESR